MVTRRKGANRFRRGRKNARAKRTGAPAPAPAVDSPLDQFVRLSVTLTGFDAAELYGTGMVPVYYALMPSIIGDIMFGRFLTRWSYIWIRGEGDEKLLESLVKNQLLDDDTYGPLARNLAALWYLGQWNQLPAAWRDVHGAWANDITFIPSSQSYTQGLVWRAIHSHPPGAKQPGFGSWSLPPGRGPNPMTDSQTYDAVVVGAGPVGAHVARELSKAGKSVLILEAGRASGLTYEGYQSYVSNYHTAVIKEPNSPYPQNPSAPSPLATDILKIRKGTPDLVGYQVENGPLGFGSTYLRSLGGTSLHWLGTTPRHLPNDFRINSLYGVGVDWPITYDDIQDYYCQAEWSIGVSANRKDQEYLGVWFPEGYDYPMERIPPSYSDQVIGEKTKGLKVELAGKEYPVRLSSLAQARNSIPRRGVIVHGERRDYTPVGAVGNPNIGQRCEGNACCIPICPIQAKYSALKTIAELDRKRVTILTQAVASGLLIAPNGRIDGVKYLRYETEGGPVTKAVAKGTIYVLAAHAVENAKLLLASNAANSSDQVGRNLMDHPFFFTWALAPQSMGMFRGPAMTSGIESLRDGAFRTEFAAFRIDPGNWGWDIVTFPPDGDVTGALAKNVFGKKLRSQLGNTLPRQVRIGFDLEQLPEPGNRVTISREYMDAIGCFRPVIDYGVSDYTWQSMVEAIKVSEAVYRAMGIPKQDMFHQPPPGLPDEERFMARDGKEYLLHFIGAGHHIGTHRMGNSRTNSVVNRNQRSWDHDNLYVVGCGSHPTTGTANPTLTALALSLMAAKDMLTQLR